MVICRISLDVLQLRDKGGTFFLSLTLEGDTAGRVGAFNRRMSGFDADVDPRVIETFQTVLAP